MSTVDFYLEYQRKKRISDFKEEAEAQASLWLSILVYQHFKCSGPVTKKQEEIYLSNYTRQEFIKEWADYYLRTFTPETPRHLRTFSPNKGKNMNVTPNTNTVDTPDSMVGSETVSFYVDAEGNRVEIPFDTDSDGEAAQPVTTFIAEDAADHAVTVH